MRLPRVRLTVRWLMILMAFPLPIAVSLRMWEVNVLRQAQMHDAVASAYVTIALAEGCPTYSPDDVESDSWRMLMMRRDAETRRLAKYHTSIADGKRLSRRWLDILGTARSPIHTEPGVSNKTRRDIANIYRAEARWLQGQSKPCKYARLKE